MSIYIIMIYLWEWEDLFCTVLSCILCHCSNIFFMFLLGPYHFCPGRYFHLRKVKCSLVISNFPKEIQSRKGKPIWANELLVQFHNKRTKFVGI